MVYVTFLSLSLTVISQTHPPPINANATAKLLCIKREKTCNCRCSLRNLWLSISSSSQLRLTSPMLLINICCICHIVTHSDMTILDLKNDFIANFMAKSSKVLIHCNFSLSSSVPYNMQLSPHPCELAQTTSVKGISSRGL